MTISRNLRPVSLAASSGSGEHRLATGVPERVAVVDLDGPSIAKARDRYETKSEEHAAFVAAFKACSAQGMNLRDVARFMGVAPQTLSDWLHGKRRTQEWSPFKLPIAGRAEYARRLLDANANDSAEKVHAG